MFRVVFVVKSATDAGEVQAMLPDLNGRWHTNSYGLSGVEGLVANVGFSISAEEYASCNMYAPYRRLLESNPQLTGYDSYVWVTTNKSLGKMPLPGSPGMAWTTGPGNVPHEMAHSLGNHHYHSLSCPTNEVLPTCFEAEAGGGDFTAYHHSSAAVKEHFGWLEVPEVGNGEYELAPLEKSSGLRAVKIHITDKDIWGNPYKSYLYLSYRQSGTTVGVIADYTVPWPPPPSVWRLVKPYPWYVVGGRKIGVSILKADTVSTIVGIDTAYIPAPPPECVPLPPQYRTIACPRGQKGSIVQRRESHCPGPTWGPWTTVSNTCRKGGAK